jgi:hypothetical protein
MTNQPYRSCGKCGQYTVPFGVDWSHWENGKPIGLECIDQPEPNLRDKLYKAALFTVTTNNAKHYEKIAAEFADEATEIIETEKEAAVRKLLQGIVDNAPSNPDKRNDGFYFDIGWEVMKILGQMHQDFQEQLTHPQASEGEEK